VVSVLVLVISLLLVVVGRTVVVLRSPSVFRSRCAKPAQSASVKRRMVVEVEAGVVVVVELVSSAVVPGSSVVVEVEGTVS
jgi:hypothetical protein